MSVINVLLLLSSCLSLGVGFWLLFYSKHNRSYIYLALTVLSSSLWAAAIYFTLAYNSLFIGNFSFIFGGLIFAFLIFFLLSFTHWLSLKNSLLIGIPTFAIVMICLVPNAISQQISVDGGYINMIKAGPLLPVYYLYILFCLAIMAYFLRKVLKKIYGVRRRQIQYISIGFLSAMMLGITFNLILPAFGQFHLNNLGPVFILVLIGTTVIAGTKHYIYGRRVILSELYSVLLIFIALTRLVMVPTFFSYFLTIAVAGICYLFIQSVLSEADKNFQLERDKKELKKLDRMKDEFLMVATHELNTPVTVIRGKLSMILDEDFGKFSAAEKEYLKPIAANAEKLNRLYREVLEVLKIDQKQLAITRENTDLKELVLEVVNALKDAKSDYHLEMDLPQKPIMLNFDRKKIKEIIEELLDNAIKYSSINGASGKIKITLTMKDNEATFAIHDNGVGISKEDQHHLMEKFFQSKRFDAFTPQEQQGAGLSLYIAKNIMDLHHGRIWFESKEDEGSTFYFSLK